MLSAEKIKPPDASLTLVLHLYSNGPRSSLKSNNSVLEH